MSRLNFRWLAPGLALSAGVLACSYDPRPQDGMQECYKNRCPDGYVCALGNRCYRPDHLPALPGLGGGTLPPGTGGGGLGGVIGRGGQTSLGGAIGLGGVIGRGGQTGLGGVIGFGGQTGLGGVIGFGGATGHGGRTGVGGAIVGSGGVTGQGGVIGTGGTTSQGGTTSTGGTTTPPNTGTVMTVSAGQGQGAMTGYGWVTLAALDTLTDPTCDSPAGPIVSGLDCMYTVWSTTDSLCISGRIPKLPSAPTDEDFELNWGVTLGINATPDHGVLGQAFSTVTVSLMGSPLTGLRLFVRRKSDPPGSIYCANLIPGKAISFTSLNTACWDSSGKYLAASDVPDLVEIGLVIPSSTDGSITISNLCLVGITFGK